MKAAAKQILKQIENWHDGLSNLALKSIENELYAVLYII